MADLDLGERVESLLAEGLEHFGNGRADRAIVCWREVLHLDPTSIEARDYLADAGAGEKPESSPSANARPYKESLLAEAIDSIALGDLEPAFEVLELLAAQEPADLPIQGHYELARTELARVYRRELGDGATAYEIESRDRLYGLNLPTEAGYLASLVDGEATLDSILDVSAIDRFETVRTLVRLKNAGVIREKA